jgi:hypothetical protein
MWEQKTISGFQYLSRLQKLIWYTQTKCCLLPAGTTLPWLEVQAAWPSFVQQVLQSLHQEAQQDGVGA